VKIRVDKERRKHVKKSDKEGRERLCLIQISTGHPHLSLLLLLLLHHLHTHTL